jgi:hypothetical protein
MRFTLSEAPGFTTRPKDGLRGLDLDGDKGAPLPVKKN